MQLRIIEHDGRELTAQQLIINAPVDPLDCARLVRYVLNARVDDIHS